MCLTDTVIQSDYRLQAKETLLTNDSKYARLKGALQPMGQTVVLCTRKAAIKSNLKMGHAGFVYLIEELSSDCFIRALNMQEFQCLLFGF